MIKKLSFLIIAILMFSIGVQAQWMQRNYIKRTLKIHSDTSVVIFEIIEDEIHLKPDADYTYYWYTNRKIMSNKGGIGGYVLDGPYTRYNRKDCLMAQGTFRYGLKWGEWKHWDDKGNLLRAEPYKNGLVHGKVAVYDFEGKKQILIYKRGIQTNDKKESVPNTVETEEPVKPKPVVVDSISAPTVASDSVTVEQPVKKKRTRGKKTIDESIEKQQDQILPSNEN
ncbi:MAG: hypothetical protein WCX31_02280 [Salinivirgaceae bacterium]|jgi:hypothetical protein